MSACLSIFGSTPCRQPCRKDGFQHGTIDNKHIAATGTDFGHVQPFSKIGQATKVDSVVNKWPQKPIICAIEDEYISCRFCSAYPSCSLCVFIAKSQKIIVLAFVPSDWLFLSPVFVTILVRHCYFWV